MFSGNQNLLREGNIRAFKLGIYIATVITVLGIYNLIVKMFFDPCCQEHTSGEFLIQIGTFLSSVIGGGMFLLILVVIVKSIIERMMPQQDISWRVKKESGLNMLFVAILILNFGLLLVAQAPITFIGCFRCEPEATDVDNVIYGDNQEEKLNLPFSN